MFVLKLAEAIPNAEVVVFVVAPKGVTAVVVTGAPKRGKVAVVLGTANKLTKENKYIRQC